MSTDLADARLAISLYDEELEEMRHLVDAKLCLLSCYYENELRMPIRARYDEFQEKTGDTWKKVFSLASAIRSLKRHIRKHVATWPDLEAKLRDAQLRAVPPPDDVSQ
jgi:hypothetical protein